MSEIEDVQWGEVADWLVQLSADFRWDGIVGVSRGGVVLAIALSHLQPNVPLHFVYQNEPVLSRGAFYVFEPGRPQRLAETQSALRLTDNFFCRNPIVLDDVATFGDTITVASDLVRSAGAMQITLALFALDRQELDAARPEIAPHILHRREIDNSSTWLRFPWQLEVDG